MKHLTICNGLTTVLVGSRAAALDRLSMLPGVRVPPYFCLLAQDGRPSESDAGLAGAYRQLGRCFGEAEPLVSVRLAKASSAGGRAPYAGVRGLAALVKAIGCLRGADAVRAKDGHTAEPGAGERLTLGTPVIVQRMVDEPASLGMVSTAPTAAIAIYAVPYRRPPGAGKRGATATAWMFKLPTGTLVKRHGGGSEQEALDADTILELVMQARCIGAQFADRWQVPALELEFTVDRRGSIFYTQVRPGAVIH